MASYYDGLDQLSNAPPEIILRITTLFLNTSENATLSQVSKYFRKFMKTHVKAITNRAIQERFADEAEFLKCEVVDGWLLPKHQGLFDIQNAIEQTCRVKLERMAGSSPHNWKFTYKIATPAGPQFLFMLENRLVMRRAQAREIWAKQLNRDKQGYRNWQGTLKEYPLGSFAASNLSLARYQVRIFSKGFKGSAVVGQQGEEPELSEEEEDRISDLTIPRDAWGISTSVLGKCLQVLNCTSKYIQPIDKWMEAHLYPEIGARPKHPMAWFHGVPNWYCSRPMDEVWNKWYLEEGVGKEINKSFSIHEGDDGDGRQIGDAEAAATDDIDARDFELMESEKRIGGNVYTWFSPS